MFRLLIWLIAITTCSRPIVIDEPVLRGYDTVSGTACPGETLLLRVLQSPPFEVQATAGADGKFTARVELLAAWRVWALDNDGREDIAVVSDHVTFFPVVFGGAR